jgi:hypothetical protein
MESGRVAAHVAGEALGAGDCSRRFLERHEHRLRRRLYRRHKAFLRAERWFRLSPVANFIIARVGQSTRLQELARQVLHGEKDAAAIFSVRGAGRILVSR